MRIALFATCLADTLFPNVVRATLAILERLGHDVDFPERQTCCGQMHINSGYQQQGLRAVRNHVEAFEPYAAIVGPSPSCVGSVRHQHAKVASRAGDAQLALRAEALAARTYDLAEFLIDVLHVDDVGAVYPHRVAYHPTCHSLRVLRVGTKPVQLLQKVRDIELLEVPDAEQCCGFGGTFAIKNSDTSAAMLRDKIASVEATGAEFCAASDASCLMHLAGGIARLRSGLRTVHLAEILASTGSQRR